MVTHITDIITDIAITIQSNWWNKRFIAMGIDMDNQAAKLAGRNNKTEKHHKSSMKSNMTCNIPML